MTKLRMFFVLFILAHFAAGVAGAAQEHCCLNELCPIDCVRCDGKPTCYDLSDELGCSNATDKKLLSYEKPPVFVPIILAVLKAQLRREKVELSYRFPDRNCFGPFTSTPVKGNQPSYDVMGIKTPGTTTTEMPLWLQLLKKLKASFGTTASTTTTTEMPVWKMLMNKLKAEQNGNSYITDSPVKSWSKVDQTTTPAYQASQTPPWRRTAPPPTTTVPEITKQSTTERRDQTAYEITQPTYIEFTQQTSTKITTTGIRQPTTPGIRQSSTTGRTQPTTQGKTQPTSPGRTQPTTPGIRQPSTPGIRQPTTTRRTQPTAGRTQPTTPGRTQPTTPGIRQPSTPGIRHPTTTRRTQPTTPGRTQPTTPGRTQPTTPGRTRPTTPGMRKPTTPDMTQPISAEIKEQSPEIRDQTTTEITPTSAPGITETTEQTTEKELSSSTSQSSPIGAPVTFKETVFFITPKQELVTPIKRQEIVTQIKSQTTSENIPDTTPIRIDPSTFSKYNLSIKPTDNSLSLKTTHLSQIRMGNDTESSSFTVTHKEYTNKADVVGIKEANHNKAMSSQSNERSGVENVTKFSAFSSIVPTTENPNVYIETDNNVNLTVSFNYNHTQGRPTQGFRNESETKELTTPRSGKETTTAASHMQIIDVTTGKEYLQRNISDIFSVSTDLPLLLATADFGVTISTEFAKTVTESETPSSLQERVTPPISENELIKTNLPEIKFGFNDSGNISLGTFESEVSNKTDFPTPSSGVIKQHDNGQIYVNTSNFINASDEMYSDNGKGSILDYSLSNPSNSNMISDLSDVQKLVDQLLSNYQNASVSLLSGNVTSSDFIYPSMDTKLAAQESTNVNYSVGESNIHGLELYNSSRTKDTFQSYNSTGNDDRTFSVSIVEKQEKISNTLKDKLATSSIQMSPENEVRIMLGKLNALVSKTAAPPYFSSQPVLREVTQVQPGTTMVHRIATETPSVVTQPPTMAPITQYPERSQVIQPVTVPQVQSATVTPLPWWQQTTLSPFSLDNLFGFTSPLHVGHDWFNPSTNSWDAMFGAGGVSVSQVTTVPSYNANQDRLNNIYDPLSADTHIPDTSINQLVQHAGSFGEGQNANPPAPPTGNLGQEITTKPVISHTDYSIQTEGAQNYFSKAENSTKKAYVPSWNHRTDKHFIPQAKQSTTLEPPLKGFDIFNTLMDSLYPGNFSIVEKPSVQTTVSPVVKPTTKSSQNSKSFVVTTASNPPPLESIPAEFIALSVTFPPVKQQNNTQISKSVPPAVITTKRTPFQEKIYTPATLSAKKQDVKTVYDITTPRPATPRGLELTTKLPFPPMSSILTNFWRSSKPVEETYVKPVTDPVPVRPVTRPIPVTPVTDSVPVTQSTTFSYWNPGSHRVLPTDTISSWWAQVQSPTAAPAYVTHQTPTPTPVSTLDQCYQTQDPTGFCQSRYSGHYKNPDDCRSFYVCIWGFLHSCACPPHTMFDDNINVCNWDHLVTCTKQV